jgi:tRNA (guanine10-N2)-methyltransferase
MEVTQLNNHNPKIEEGSARPLVKKFDVKKREYYGNTSMEAEISLLMANQALV